MPYTQNSDYALIYTDMGTGVWLAPKGTTLPTDLAEPGAAFNPVGWLAEDDGIAFNTEKDIKEYHALQGGSLIKRKVGKVVQKFTFTCLEETALVMGLVHADQAVTKTGSGATAIAKMNYTQNQSRSVERAMVLDTVAGAYTTRYTASAVDLTFQGEVPLSAADDLKKFKFEATIIAGAAGELITNSPGMVA